MNILLVDVVMTGHCEKYFNSIKKALKREDNHVLVLGPADFDCDYKFEKKGRRFLDYIRLVQFVKKIVKIEDVDVVHFLLGDPFYRYFGLGLGHIKSKKIITCHQMRRSVLRDISYKMILKKFDIGVVHCSFLINMLKNELNVMNVMQVEYPCFQNNIGKSKEASREILGIDVSKGTKVIAAIAGTRYDKGVDILLEALNKVNSNFHLLIAGKEETFNKDFIINKSIYFLRKETLLLKFLTDDELYNAENSADIIILPYRKVFDGASGPLTEGVALGKTIIGPSHGSLGKIIMDNHLGYTFEAENAESLAKAIDNAINGSFEYDKEALAYRSSLKEENFQNKYLQIYNQL